MCEQVLIFRMGNRLGGVSIQGGHLVGIEQENDFLGFRDLGGKAGGIELGATEIIMLTPFGGWWSRSGFSMMFELGGGFVGVGSNDTLPSLIRSWISCLRQKHLSVVCLRDWWYSQCFARL